MGTATFCDVLLAILLPPLGVFFKYGCANILRQVEPTGETIVAPFFRALRGFIEVEELSERRSQA